MQGAYCLIFDICLQVVRQQGIMDLTAPFRVQMLTVNTVTQRPAPVRAVNLATKVTAVYQVKTVKKTKTKEKRTLN